MKVLIAPDKFKGSLSAVAAAEAIARGWLQAWPESAIQLAPIADGGEGFSDALRLALNGAWVTIAAHDALGRKIEARYAWIESRKTAVIEMSEASGLWRLKSHELSPLHASTFGTGELIRHASENGAELILVGLGGSATTDGGTGMAAALGYRFLGTDDQELTVLPGQLRALERIDAQSRVKLPPIVAACDVENPLLGSRGTAAVFSRQKGADEEQVAELELSMEHLAKVVRADLQCDFERSAGAGAAGGLGFGLLSFCGAKIRSGFEVVAEALQLEEQIRSHDLILTGEGRLDGQTLEGKGPAGVAALARRLGKPSVAFAGSISTDPAVALLFSAACPIIDQPIRLEEAIAGGAEFLERTAFRAAQLIQLGQAL